MLPPHLATPLLAADEIEEVGFDLVLIYPVDNDATKDAQRASIAARCRTVGLIVELSRSRDQKQVFLKLRCSTLKMEEMAAATKMPMRLISGGYAPYSIAQRAAFVRASASSPFSSMERIQLLLSILEVEKARGGCEVDLDKCLREKTLEQVLPIHEEAQVQRLFRSWCLAPWSFYPFQPLDDVRDYFGPKAAFYFAFVGHMARSLLVPAIVGGAVVAADVFHYGTLDNPTSIVYSLFMLIWATAFAKRWRNRESELGFRWHVLDFEQLETSRQEFEGTPARGFYTPEGYFVDIPESHKHRSRVDVTLKFTHAERTKRMATSYLVITPLIFGVLIGTVAILSYRSFLQLSLFKGAPLVGLSIDSKKGVLVGSILGGVINAVFISVTNGLYARLARKLNDWENHRTETQYEDSLIIKTFLFQAINSYISLFYIAFLKSASISLLPGHDEYCHDPSDFDATEAEIEAAHRGFNPFCMGELSTQLTSLVITRSIIGKLREFAEPKLKAWLRVFRQSRAMKKAARDEKESNKRPPSLKVSYSKTSVIANGGAEHSGEAPPMSSYEAQSSAYSFTQAPSFPDSNARTLVSPSPPSSPLVGMVYPCTFRQTTSPLFTLRLAPPVPFLPAASPRPSPTRKRRAELEPFDNSLYSEYSSLIIQLGYVVLFAPAFPIAALVSYVNTVTEMRSDAYKFLFSMQRPRIAGAQDIGSWQTVLWLMGTVAVFTNLGLLGLTARQLDMLLPFSVLGVWEVNTYNKGAFLFFVEHLILAAQFVVSHYLPDVPKHVARAKALEDFETQAELGILSENGGEVPQDGWDDAKDIPSELLLPAVPPPQ